MGSTDGRVSCPHPAPASVYLDRLPPRQRFSRFSAFPRALPEVCSPQSSQAKGIVFVFVFLGGRRSVLELELTTSAC
jgi:hypothetical protein